VPTNKREETSKLSPREKLLQDIQGQIDELGELQKRYDHGRATGEISEPIAFLEKGDRPSSED